MRSPKSWLIVLMMAVLVLGLVSATPPQSDRPRAVKEASWIGISERAGIAVVRMDGRNRVIGRLYVKRGTKWLEVAVENAPYPGR